MARETSHLALFPLTTHVLPGGRTHLRIFEPRYLRMVKESLLNNSGFGLCMLDPDGSKADNTHIFPRGTLVQIVDFTQHEDGLLGITVAGQQMFDIQSIDQDHDGLRHGVVELLPDQGIDQEWPDEAHHKMLRQRLIEVFDSYPEISELYPDKKLDDELWVCQRWLELLPLKPCVKQELLRELGTATVPEYLFSLFQQEVQSTDAQ